MRSTILLLVIFLSQISLIWAQPPSVHSSSIQFNNTYCHQMDVSWTKGDGSQRIVIAKEGSAVDATPNDNRFYQANDTFGLGDEISTDNFVVFNGVGSSFTFNGLKKNTTYHFAIYEFNGSGIAFSYLTSGSFAKASNTSENITAGFSIDDTYQCLSGNSFTFTNSSSQTRSGGITYSWKFGDNTTSSAKDPTHTYAVGGIFNVQLTASSTGCKHVAQLKDTIVVPYITDFQLDPTVAGNDSIQCLDGNYFAFENLSTIPAKPIYGTYDAANYLWITSDGQSGNLYDVNFSFNKAGTVKVKLYTRRKVARQGDFCTDSIEKSFVVLPPPIMGSNVSFSDTALCLNDNVFTFSHNAPNITSTTWNFGDGQSSSNNPAVHTYKSSGKKIVTIDVVDVNGCTAGYVDSVEIFEEPDNYFSGLDTIYCLNDPMVLLKPNLSGGRFEGGNVNALDSTFSPVSVGSFDVRYIYSQGNCKDTFTIKTRVRDIPVFSLGPDTFICPGNSVLIDSKITGYQFQWNDGSGGASKSIGSEGSYWLKAIDGICSAADTVFIREIRAPSFDLGLDTTLCGGQSITLTFDADEADYIWSDGYSSPATSRVIDESGYYELTVTNACGTQTDNVTINILPYACEIFVPNAFSPNGDILNEVFKPLGFFEFTDMTIFNEYGEVLFYTDKEDTGWDGTYLGNKVQSGTYYYHIRYQLPENGSMSKKQAAGSVLLID